MIEIRNEYDVLAFQKYGACCAISMSWTGEPRDQACVPSKVRESAVQTLRAFGMIRMMQDGLDMAEAAPADKKTIEKTF
jgi:hypothetical protein